MGGRVPLAARRGPQHRRLHAQRLPGPHHDQLESLLQFGNNAYAKPATALGVLRETILGRATVRLRLQDLRAALEVPSTATLGFFRTMEDASGVDLDWFWRGWFYSTDHVDIGLGVREFAIDSKDPEVEKGRKRAERDAEAESLSVRRNADLARLTNILPELKDFYNSYDLSTSPTRTGRTTRSSWSV